MDSEIYGSNPDEDAELEAELLALQQDSPSKDSAHQRQYMYELNFRLIQNSVAT